MLHNLATITDDYARFGGNEVTVKCRVIGSPKRGETGGEKVMYEVADPSGNLELPTMLSFWLEEPTEDGFTDLSKTDSAVLTALSRGSNSVPNLRRGETVLVRGIPKLASKNGKQLFINVTSVVIREPEIQIGKSEIRTQESCPREYYLRYVKKTYHNKSLNKNSFRGTAVHLVTEQALNDHPEKFAANGWTESEATSFAEEVVEERLSIEQAKIGLAGIKLKEIKGQIEEIAARLFTSESFCDRIADAKRIQTEHRLPPAYGYNGFVDIILDGVPYDLKTSRNLFESNQEKHRQQLKLYLFALALEQLEVGEQLEERIETGQTGYLVYPNLEDSESVSIEQVTLELEDVATLLTARNEVAASRDTFGPPSPYNRDCEGCEFKQGYTVASTGETLPPACTFYCQDERRWPCYELSPSGAVETECSRFDDCDQRLAYRDTDVTDHYNALRSALQQERETRQAAGELLSSVDEDALTRTGRVVTGLSLSGASQDTIVYNRDSAVVSAFTPGDIVRIEPESDGQTGRYVPYLGRRDGGFVFGFEDLDPVFMDPAETYRVWYGFDTETVTRKYLPYLDYAQRSGAKPGFEYEERNEIAGEIELDDPTDIVDYLDNDEVFVDLPARRDRSTILAEAVSSLATAAYPHPENKDEVVPEAGRRALILGTSPKDVEIAHRAAPDGPNYRFDDFSTGSDTIHASLRRAEIQKRLLESRTLVSSLQYAVRTGTFHDLAEGGYGDRDHSKRFFDVVVILGAEQVTEPVYLYLRDVADRVVTIGDKRAHGPKMVSSDAREQGLNRSYFEGAHDRYASIPADGATSLQFSGEGNAFIRELFRDDSFEELDSKLSFLGISGGESTDASEITLNASVRVRRGSGAPQKLVFDISHTSANPFEVQQAFIDREYLDATNLPSSEGSVLLDGTPLYLTSKEPLEGDMQADSHRIVIHADADTIPAFSKTFLYNRIEARIVAQVTDSYDPDYIVTPFEAHANELAFRLEEQGLDTPVKLAHELDGDIADRAIVSFAVANDAGILHPPLTDPETLYSLLSAAEDILIVGHSQTLKSKDALKKLVTEQAEKYEA